MSEAFETADHDAFFPIVELVAHGHGFEGGVKVPVVVILDGDENVTHWLTLWQARKVAERILQVVDDLEAQRPVRRLHTVDERLREMDL